MKMLCIAVAGEAYGADYSLTLLKVQSH